MTQRPELVGSEGNPRNPIWLIGRDFGDNERQTGRPFQGLAGSRVDGHLRQASIKRSDLFIHNVVAKQPRKNDWDMHFTDDVLEGYTNLQTSIKQYKPKFIIAFGNQAFRTVMSEAPDSKEFPGIEQARGFLWDSPLGPQSPAQ